MEVLHPTAPLGEPNMCIICSETPNREDGRVIDTGQTMIAPFSDNVWHKYVCEKCGLTIANRLGYVSNEQAKAAFHAAEAATERLDAVREKILTAAAEIHEFATDVSLGTERARVSKTVEGEYIEPPKPATSKPKAASARKPKAGATATSSTAAIGST